MSSVELFTQITGCTEPMTTPVEYTIVDTNEVIRSHAYMGCGKCPGCKSGKHAFVP